MTHRIVQATALLLVMGATVCSAGIITQPTSEGGWDIRTSSDTQPANGTLTTGVTLGGHTDAGRIVNDTGLIPETDLVFSDDTVGAGGLVGNYISLSVRSLTADFYAFQDFGVNPEDFRLYMLANGNVWYYDLGPQSTGWNEIVANMVHIDDQNAMYYGGWYNLADRTQSQFLSDIANVTRLGFELSYVGNQANQTFGFDNFILYDTYFVPEPETYLVIAVALASLAFVFRTHIRDVVRIAYATVAS